MNLIPYFKQKNVLLHYVLLTRPPLFSIDSFFKISPNHPNTTFSVSVQLWKKSSETGVLNRGDLLHGCN